MIWSRKACYIRPKRQKAKNIRPKNWKGQKYGRILKNKGKIFIINTNFVKDFRKSFLRNLESLTGSEIWLDVIRSYLKLTQMGFGGLGTPKSFKLIDI